MTGQLTVIIEREGDGYVALCPELDIASQGATVTQARENVKEALELFSETASATEIQHRLHEDKLYNAFPGRGLWCAQVSPGSP